MTKKLYQSQTVRKIRAFYGPLLVDYQHFKTIASHLAAIANKMWEGVKSERPFIYQEINNYHPDYLGMPVGKLKNQQLTLEDCQKCIAAEYGYSSWENLLELGYAPYNVPFETCVNALVEGDRHTLQKYIEIDSGLASLHSQYGHQATLLHYAVANGVEMWRQQVPFNLPELVECLFNHGANRKAKMLVYGGAFTPIELLDSSAHPNQAGVADQLKLLL